MFGGVPALHIDRLVYWETRDGGHQEMRRRVVTRQSLFSFGPLLVCPHVLPAPCCDQDGIDIGRE